MSSTAAESVAVVAAVSPAIFYFAARDLRRQMMFARLRSELFTASAFGKIFATSGSNTTTLLPRAWRRAYFPRTPFEKSYSRSIPLFFSRAFFIIPSFSSARDSRADDANIVASFGVDDNQRYRSCEPMSTVTTVLPSM